ncbi:MAG: ATP-binding protein [bacterium]|nr:ATP-binding protein [bacterium]
MEELINRIESHLLEFKREMPAPDALAKELVAFSNTKGGKIVIGVLDKTREIFGIDITQDIEEYVMNVSSNNCHPIISPLVEFYTIEGKTICVIEIFPGKLKPYFVTKKGAEKGVYIRIGSTNRIAEASWINELSRQSRNITYDRLEVVEATIDDFDLQKINFYQRRKNEKLGTPLEEISPEYLEKIGLLKRFNGHKIPTIGGLLLMGKNPQQMTSLPRAVVKCARFKGKEKGIFIDQAVIEDCLYEQIDNTVRFIAKNIRLGGIIKGLLRHDIYEYPMEVLREAITNAIVHRDYFLADSKAVYVAIFDDRIEITSPGLLPIGVEIENLGKQQKTRNPLIARMLFEMDYFDEWGQGINKMKALMKENNLPEPVFNEEIDEFKVALYGPGEDFMRKEVIG